jgi:hypothetical protein
MLGHQAEIAMDDVSTALKDATVLALLHKAAATIRNL